MDCPAAPELAEFLAGKLPRTRTAWIADHVRICSRCEAALQTIDVPGDALLAALSTVADGRAADPVPNRLLDLARSARSRPAKIGRFEFQGEIGSGSYGTVFKARDPQLDRTVAIKLLRTGRLADEEELDRFLREARSVAQLKHPGIVTLYEIGQDEGQLLPGRGVRRGHDAGRRGWTRGRCRSASPRSWSPQVADALAVRPRARASSTATSSRRTSCSTRDGPAAPDGLRPGQARGATRRR